MLMIQKVMNLDNEEKFQEDICDNFGDSNIDEENQNRLNSTKKELIFSLRNLSQQVPKEEIKKKALWLVFMDGVYLPQGYRVTMKRQFTFYH